MTTEENNKLIAEFMGIISEDKGIGLWYLENIGELGYYTSWDWLMPVVKKIFELPFDEVEGLREYSDKSNTIFDYITVGLHSSIESVYAEVIDFIKWYNNNNLIA